MNEIELGLSSDLRSIDQQLISFQVLFVDHLGIRRIPTCQVHGKREGSTSLGGIDTNQTGIHGETKE